MCIALLSKANLQLLGKWDSLSDELQIWVIEWLIYRHHPLKIFKICFNTTSGICLDFTFWNLNIFTQIKNIFVLHFYRLKAKLVHCCWMFYYEIVGKIFEKRFLRKNQMLSSLFTVHLQQHITPPFASTICQQIHRNISGNQL